MLLEEGAYGLLGWSGDRLLVADGSQTTRILSIGPQGDVIRLALAPSRFWGASPDGRWMVRVGAEETAFVRLRGGQLTEETTPIAMGSRSLAAGTWAPDSSKIAAVALGGGSAPEVVLLSPGAPELRGLPRSKGVTGAPLWSSDGDSLLFPRDSGGRAGTLDARLCDANASTAGDRKGACPSLLSWREGVVLLRMER